MLCLVQRKGDILAAVGGIERERELIGSSGVLAGLQVTAVTLLWKREGAPKKLFWANPSATVTSSQSPADEAIQTLGRVCVSVLVFCVRESECMYLHF